ncbi:MAG: hypothetical protein D9C04_03690 [Nitrosopumilus sp. B06]|nr:MAG: hypothetical protein D9C04_03690 [Nitrosopumilus sp. B06]
MDFTQIRVNLRIFRNLLHRSTYSYIGLPLGMAHTLASRLREMFEEIPSHTVNDLAQTLESEDVDKNKISKALYGLKRSGYLLFDGQGHWIKRED